MTRDEFLKKRWTPYPHWPTVLSLGGEWICGKLERLEGEVCYLHGRSEGFSVKSSASVHPILGEPLPIFLAALGDSIAFLVESKRLCGPYLLSPALHGPYPVNEEWQIFVETVREHFKSLGFRHWTTPSLVVSSGVDAHIDFMQVRGVRTDRLFTLPTSPEFGLKKALAAGQEKIFEIKHCFRDDDISPTHRPEFTMIEWYRAYADKKVLIDDFMSLLNALSHHWQLPKADCTFEVVTVAQLFKEVLDFELTPHTGVADLQNLLTQLNIDFLAEDDWDDLFFRVYIDKIEPRLVREHPVVLCDFPVSQASLAQTTFDGWADRFEIYWRGIELANAYQEQVNPQLVWETVDREIKKRKGLGRIAPQRDEDFLKAMEAGYPPSAGIALGLDRLFMVLRKAQTI